MKIFSVCRLRLTLGIILSLFFTSATLAAQSPIPSFSTSKASQFLLTDIAKTTNRLIAVGERGHVIYSSNGDDWAQAQVPVNVLLTSVAFKDDNTGFATGHDATLLKTSDGGETWSIVKYQPELDKPLLDVEVNGDRIVATGAYGLYYVSVDGGNTWAKDFHYELLLPEDRDYLMEIKEEEPESYELEKQYLLPHFNAISVKGDSWYLAGEAGFVATSRDYGQEWEIVETDYFGSYFSVLTDGSETVTLAGLRGNLFSSNDQGTNWHPVPTSAKATINNSLTAQGVDFFFANSGNLFYQTPQGDMNLHTFADGKALMSGVEFKQKLILATESGIKSIKLADLK